MTSKQAAVLQIVVALIFAGVMIGSNFFFGKDSIDEQMLIALWWIPFSLLTIGGTAGCICKRVQK